MTELVDESVQEFLNSLSDEDRAAVVEEMRAGRLAIISDLDEVPPALEALLKGAK